MLLTPGVLARDATITQIITVSYVSIEVLPGAPRQSDAGLHHQAEPGPACLSIRGKKIQSIAIARLHHLYRSGR